MPHPPPCSDVVDGDGEPSEAPIVFYICYGENDQCSEMWDLQSSFH